MTHNEPITIQIVLFDLHRLKENRNLKYAAKVQPFIQITKFWKIILKVLYTQMPVPPTSVNLGCHSYNPLREMGTQPLWMVQTAD